MRPMVRWALGSALCGLAIAATAAGAWAGERHHSQARLLQGEFAGGTWSAGVQIDLSEGWKTYWRVPGEAGIAPQFDWARSRNVADVELGWPAPGRYHDASGETIGYAQRVVFPVIIRPEDPSQPVELDLQLDYAVCKDICIPARIELHQVLTRASAAASPAAASIIRQFEARVPQSEAPGVALEQARLEETAGTYRLAVVLSGGAVDPSTEIFVESFDDAYFRAPRAVSRTGDATVFHLPIDDLVDPDLLRGRTLRLTVVTATAQLVGDLTVE
jgi:DsbC/DsbD-like thiol-disulfide interchange protein